VRNEISDTAKSCALDDAQVAPIRRAFVTNGLLFRDLEPFVRVT